MTPNLLDPPGEPVDPDALAIPKASELARWLTQAPREYVRLVETRRTDTAEVVVFDVEPQLPQVRANPIENVERIAAVFAAQDGAAPEVLALRADFPSVLHLNLRDAELPRSLCLYDVPYRDLKQRWTAARFVARVRQWLSLTATNELHQEAQPLERVLMDSDGLLIVPSGRRQAGGDAATYRVLALRSDAQADAPTGVFPLFVECPPRMHGLIHRRPRQLPDLAEVLAREGIDLLRELRVQLQLAANRGADFLDAVPVLIVEFPRTREEGGPVERSDLFAFRFRRAVANRSVLASLRAVGESVGLWELLDGQIGMLIRPDETRRGADLDVEILNPIFDTTRKTLAESSGADPADGDVQLTAIGVGALGSQVIMNLAREGFGRWTLVDHDLLLPHNLARHELPGQFVGQRKSDAVAWLANSLTGGEELFTSLPGDLLEDGVHRTAIDSAIAGSSAIIDMSASVSVGRYLASARHIDARCVSLFMSPGGADLVLLSEDVARHVPLDALEMQYYRACVRDEHMAGHLTADVTRIRYGLSCRDLGSTIPQHLVALHAAHAAREIPIALANPGARIAVYRTTADGATSRVEVAPCGVVQRGVGRWTVLTDRGLLLRLSELRGAKLPNETGGVLLGSVDAERSVIYIVDTVPSPPDSREWPTLYIRGRDGLKPEVDRVEAATGGMLEYIGEWHSHPEGVRAAASEDDLIVFEWISELMDCEGLPAVMMIVADGAHTSCFVGEIAEREELLPLDGAR